MLLGPLSLTAQSLAPTDDSTLESQDHTVKLSPFTVSASEDNGYLATTTLAGTRLKTSLGDVGASLSVITAEFLDDTGVKNVNELMTYTVGTEAAGPSGNFTGGQAAGAGFNLQDVSSVRRQPQSATRVRGIAPADLTRDYFLTEIPFDSYNVERVEISRGPNSILFGLGSPAGIVNYGTIKPTFRPHTSLSGSIGSFGSYRASLDSNIVMKDDTLAIRVAGLHSDQQFEQEPTFEKDTRGFVAALYRPWKNTTLRANYENGQIDANRPNLTSPIDNVSTWMNSTRTGWDASTQNFSALPSEMFPQQYFWQWATLWDAPDATAPTGNGVQGRRVPNIVTTSGANLLQWVGGANLAELPGNSTYRLQGLTDLSLYDFRKNLLAGTTGGATTDFESLSTSWEQNLLDNQAGVEVAYNHQSYADTFFNPIGGQESYRVRVDTNTHYLDGRVNPNFGRPYVMATPQMNESDNTRESLRATAFYELDFNRIASGGRARWLGRHVLTGLFDHQTIEQRGLDWRMGWIGAGPDNRVHENLNGGLNNFRRRVQNFIYLGPSLATAGNLADVSIDAFPMSPVWQPGAIYPITGWDIATQAWTTQSAQEYAQPISATVNRQEIDSQAVVLQSYLFSDSLVTMVGWRRDQSDSYQLSPIPTDQEGSVILDQLVPPGTPTSTLDEDVLSYSAVLHLPWQLPFVDRVSLHYSQSENFQPTEKRVDIFGKSITSPSGDSKEYGFTLSLLEKKLNLRVNWFTATVSNETNADASRLAWNDVINQAEFVALNYLYEDKAAGLATQAQIDGFGLPPTATLDLLQAKFNVLPNGQGQWTYQIPANASSASAREARGFEVEAIYNPTPDWRVAFNLGKQETISTGGGADVSEYIANRTSAWASIANLPRGVGGRPFGEWYDSTIMIPSRTVTSQDGRVSPEQRKWRANLITNYDFQHWDGWVHHFSLGGAIRWQDKVAIGYPLIANADGQLVSDIDHPHFGPSETNVDLWLSFRKPLTFKKAAWTTKLTLRNVVRSDSLVPISTQPDGSYAQVRVVAPLTWELRTTLEF